MRLGREVTAMKVPLEQLDELARRAREEHPETGDVRDVVLTRLRTEPSALYRDAPLLVFTAAYAVASIAVCAVALRLSFGAADPLEPLFALAQTLSL